MYPFINKPMAEITLEQTRHQVFVKIEGKKYVVSYYCGGGASLSWNKLKNEVKRQSKWDGKKYWIAQCSYDEFCNEFRLTNCIIEECK